MADLLLDAATLLRKIGDELKARLHADKPDLAGATFDLLCALAEKLTGERPEIRLDYPNGNFVFVYPSQGQVFWKERP
jgi:predicted proteasome-type protease